MTRKFPIAVQADVTTFEVDFADELADMMNDAAFMTKTRRLEALKEKAKDTALHGGVLLNKSGIAVIRVDASGTRTAFNQTLFKVEHARLHAKYMTEGIVRRVEAL
jgi:hypothetical protein